MRVSAWDVAGTPPLGDDSPQALLAGDAKQLPAVVERVRESNRRLRRVEEPLQRGAALGQRSADQERSLEVEEIEDVVDERPLAAAEQRWARASLRVERADLAVDDTVEDAKPAAEPLRDRPVALRQVLTAVAEQRHVALSQATDCSLSRPRDLVEPVAGRHRVPRDRTHRL